MGKKFKVGTISEILAKESGGQQQVDPKLVALFSGASSTDANKVFKTVKVSNEKKPKSDQKGPSPKKFVREKEVKLKHKDAAAIRVDAKRKIKAELVEESEKTSTKPKKGKKQKLKSLNKVKDESVLSSEPPQESGKGKTKSGKRKRPESLEKIPSPKRLKQSPVKSSSTEDSKPNKPEVKQEGKDVKPVEPTTTAAAAAAAKKATLVEKNAPKPKTQELEARTIFVGNLPHDLKKKALRKLFMKFGEIETVRLRCGAPDKPTTLKKVAVNKRELHPDNNTLAAFIRYSTREEAQKASEEGVGLIINEHHLVVDLADHSVKKDNKKAIFVGNLSLKLTDEELWRFFEDCGKITSVRIIRDSATGMGKGFGYVNFDDKAAVVEALKKNQETLKNRSVRISRCVKKLKVKKTKGQGKNKSGKSTGMGKVDTGRPQFKNMNFGAKQTDRKNFNRGKLEAQPTEYGGDRLAEIGKLKRKSKKPNRGEIRKAKLAKLLTTPSQRKLPLGHKHQTSAGKNKSK